MKDLTSQEIAILRASWKLMAPKLHELTVYFYNNLHSIDPSLVPSFKDQYDMYKQADKALYSIGFLMASLDNLMIADAGLRKIFNEYKVSHKRIKLSDSNKVVKAFVLAAKATLRQEWNNQKTICWYRLFTVLIEILHSNENTKIGPQLVRL